MDKEKEILGRLSRPKNHLSMKVVSFRLTLEEWKDLRRAAISSGMTMTDWLRDRLTEYKEYARKQGFWEDSLSRED